MDAGANNHLDLESDVLLGTSTFFPDQGPAEVDRLLQMVSRNRYTTFLTLYGELSRLFAGTGREREFFGSALKVITVPPEERQSTVNDPLFQIWTGFALREANRVLAGLTTDTGSLEQTLNEFPSVLQRIAATTPAHPIDGDPPIRRFDVDPLIAAALPPSYEFPTDESARKQLERTGHPVGFFRDVVKIALERMRATWPECHEQFRKLVKLICYLPDGVFRSCSAARYTGVILLSAKDNSLLDLEESLVHEGGHQLLYTITEASPFIDPQQPQDELFTLPWSGQQRDLYGYFHASFIYTLLVKYFERLEKREESELRRAENRLAFILKGLTRALPDLHASKGFSPYGRELLESLAREVRLLEDRHAGLMAKSASA
jgi:hypothetical protein